MFAFLSQADFQVAFWSNFLSTLVISLMFVFWLNRATDLFKKPNLRLVVKQNGLYKNKLALSKNLDGDYEATFVLAIRNDGRLIIKAGEGYWHAYNIIGQGNFSVAGEDNHQRDMIKFPILPNSFNDVTGEYKLHVKQEDVKNFTSIPFFFSTTHGYFPRGVELDKNTGSVTFSSMGHIKIEI